MLKSASRASHAPAALKITDGATISLMRELTPADALSLRRARPAAPSSARICAQAGQVGQCCAGHASVTLASKVE